MTKPKQTKPQDFKSELDGLLERHGKELIVAIVPKNFFAKLFKKFISISYTIGAKDKIK